MKKYVLATLTMFILSVVAMPVTQALGKGDRDKGTTTRQRVVKHRTVRERGVMVRRVGHHRVYRVHGVRGVRYYNGCDTGCCYRPTWFGCCY